MGPDWARPGQRRYLAALRSRLWIRGQALDYRQAFELSFELSALKLFDLSVKQFIVLRMLVGLAAKTRSFSRLKQPVRIQPKGFGQLRSVLDGA